jgi:monoamine oxidase
MINTAKMRQCGAEKTLSADGRLFFAGEACSLGDFTTAHGAYLTGIDAANQVIALRVRRT